MNKKQSLFHIAKRDTLPWYKTVLIRGGAIVLALIVCAIVTTLLTGENPIKVYSTILYGAFGTSRKSWVTFHNLAILLGISLAVTPAFKMRFWNIGAEGQVLIGCLATAACMICLGGKIPNGLLIVIMIVASVAAGALWGFLPGIFKAKWNTNETLFTLMMNYIATQLAAFFIIVWEVPKGSGKIGIINQNTEAGWLPVLGGQRYLLPILLVAILTGVMYIYRAHDDPLRRDLRPHRPAAHRWYGPHADHHHRRRTRLHRGHGLLDGQVQPHHDDLHEPSYRGPEPRRERDLQRVQPEPLLRRYPDGHHPLLHHRQRVFHQLQGQPAQEQEGGVKQ